MPSTYQSGYDVCYLGGRQSVAYRAAGLPTMIDSSSTHRLPIEARWLVWTRSVLALLVVAVVATLGIANVTLYSRYHEVEDGVLWSARAEGLTAAEIAPASAAAASGVQRGDVLVAIDGSPVSTPADVVQHLHRAHEGTRLRYTLLRFGTQQGLEVSLAAAPRGSPMYFVLAAVGLFTLMVGASV